MNGTTSKMYFQWSMRGQQQSALQTPLLLAFCESWNVWYCVIDYMNYRQVIQLPIIRTFNKYAFVDLNKTLEIRALQALWKLSVTVLFHYAQYHTTF